MKNHCTFCNRPILHGIAHKACLENSLKEKDEPVTMVSRREPNFYAPVIPFNPNQPATANFQCPFCRSTAGYRVVQKTSTAGWVCTILLLCIFPFNFLFMLLQEKTYFCQSCGMRLG